ncbi:hypothetical protein AFCA_002585 [Aspergillus flavus]|uniref:NACHT domain-containing protein n=1 Tax=Aspergillus flavus TaxID=5059 RepID=A0AB74CBD8_ASPFL|nr:hypothetical protein COH21_013027 [Aspergillus flavus]RMZ43548.1 hypothetical protein CA14_009216 [Aspergillus flavus]UDD54942.1 hypothetical protein AFCA_002585 [Aspergillus flavus]
MDGWSALGAAAAIAQFIDFGIRLVSTTVKNHKTPREVSELQGHKLIVERLQALVGRLTDESSSTGLGTAENDLAIKAICDECKRTGGEMLAVVERIYGDRSTGVVTQLKGHGNRRKWKSFRQALLQVWNEDKVVELSNRLHILRQDLTVHLLAALSTQADQRAQEAGQMHLIGQEFLQTLAEPEKWQEYLINALQQKGVEKRLPPPDMERGGATHHYEDSIISVMKSLQYPGVMDRETTISQAHEDTLKWIFRDPEPQGFQWASLVDWLESNTSPNLYWVTGKAGSGKSTLIKYIHRHELTMRALGKWSPSQPVVTPVFYFWNSGRPMQMSLLGLLQTLLLGVLRAKPEYIPLVSRSRWEAHRLFAMTMPPWTQEEVLEALIVAIRHCAQSSKLCLFIDGLDEFEGKPEDLIALVKSFLLPNVKVCAASRPWPVFRDAFGRDPGLILEHLNLPDISLYVTNHLNNNAGFLELKAHEPKHAESLAHEITLRSSGVFLWVSLVVHELLQGLSRGDRLSDMQRTLEELPSELERLFEVMITSLGLLARKRAAEMFRIVGAARGPLPLLVFGDADEENPKYALEFEPRVRSQDQRLSRCLGIERRLNSYCKGLLEVKMLWISKDCTEGKPIKVNDAQQMLSLLQDPEDIAGYVDGICNSRVEYLHRTVRDYLARPNVKTQLDEWSASAFHPDLSLASAFLISLKTIDPITVTRAGFWWPINRCLAYAARFEKGTASSPDSLLNELDRVACNLSLSRTGDNQTVWRSIAKVPKRNTVPPWPSTLAPIGNIEERSFLGLALQCNLYGYVQTTLQNRPLTELEITGWPLLLSAFTGYNTSGADIPMFEKQQPPASLLQMLLRNGADPRASSVANLTAWQFVLRECHCASGTNAASPGSLPYWVDVLLVFAEWSADSRQPIPIDAWAVIQRYWPDIAKVRRAKIRKCRPPGIIRWLSSLHQAGIS